MYSIDMEKFNTVSGEDVDSQNGDYQEPGNVSFDPENAKIIVEQHEGKPPIRVLDSELNEIEDPEAVERVSSLLEKQIGFVAEKYGVNKELLQTRLDNILVVKWRPGNPYAVIYNGKKIQIPECRNAAAFSNHVVQSYNVNEEFWDFKVAVFFDDMVDDYVLSHELFHALATNGNMRFDSNGIGYDKKGVSITGYNRKDEKVDSSLGAEGLNEGITELLVTKLSPGESDQYAPQVYLSNILISPNNNMLVNAYFSDNVNDFRASLKDFDGRQSSARSEDLIKIDTSTSNPIPLVLLQACVEYTISYCDNVEQLTMERKRLIPIFKKILEHNKFNDSSDEQEIINMINDTLLSKKKELLKK